jgi:hypothetical protein
VVLRDARPQTSAPSAHREVTHHAVELLSKRGTDLGRPIEATAELHSFRHALYAAYDLRRPCDGHTGANRRPDLPRIDEDAACGARDGRIQVRIGHDDDRRLAAELERDALQVAGGRLHDELSDLARTRKGDLGDVLVPRQRSSGRRAETGHDIYDTGWYSRLNKELPQAQRCERRFLGGLHHAAAACRERWSELGSRE